MVKRSYEGSGDGERVVVVVVVARVCESYGPITWSLRSFSLASYPPLGVSTYTHSIVCVYLLRASLVAKKAKEKKKKERKKERKRE